MDAAWPMQNVCIGGDTYFEAQQQISSEKQWNSKAWH